MRSPFVNRAFTFAWAFLACLGAPGQVPTIHKAEPKKPAPFAPPRHLASLSTQSQIAGNAPARLTPSEYLSLLPMVSRQMGTAPGKFAAHFIPATALVKPGDILSFGVGAPPAGCSIRFTGAWVSQGKVPWEPFESGGPYVTQGAEVSSFQFGAPIQGTGLYLITIYLASNPGTAKILVESGDVNSKNIGEQSPLPITAPANGRIHLVQEVTLTDASYLFAWVLTDRNTSPIIKVTGCDFVRVK